MWPSRALGWAGLACAALGVTALAAACHSRAGLAFDDGDAADGSGPSLIHDGGAPEGCVGLECRRELCDAGRKTTVTGIVYDPARKVPLYNVIVFVPNAPLKPITEGMSCDRCGSVVSGNALSIALTDANGQFLLEDVPSGADIPLVIQVGKWRRKVTIPHVEPCTNTPLTDADLTRLPRTQAEGDIPRIALATGGADPLECLLRKVGIDDSEFTNSDGAGRVHLYAGHGAPSAPPATSAFDGPHGGAALSPAPVLWNDLTQLKKYDVVLLACEGDVYEDTKPASARQAMFDYASLGGRIFASHWHESWVANGPPPFPYTGSWNPRLAPPDPTTGVVDDTFPKGAAFRDWLVNAGASKLPKQLVIREPRHDLDSVDTTRAQRWISVENSNALDPAGQPRTTVQYMSFNTPIGVAPDQQCGRVVFSDLHVSSGDPKGAAFPAGCLSANLSPQEKALEFMLFDLSACIQRDDSLPVPPPIK